MNGVTALPYRFLICARCFDTTEFALNLDYLMIDQNADMTDMFVGLKVGAGRDGDFMLDRSG